MGRSFDRGGQSRKERMRGKRRAFQQAERDREMREAVVQAKRTAIKTLRDEARQPHSEPVVATAEVQTLHPVPAAAAVTAIAAQKHAGFLTRFFSRIFGKAA